MRGVGGDSEEKKRKQEGGNWLLHWLRNLYLHVNPSPLSN
jgi:hypothetical protein